VATRAPGFAALVDRHCVFWWRPACGPCFAPRWATSHCVFWCSPAAPGFRRRWRRPWCLPRPADHPNTPGRLSACGRRYRGWRPARPVVRWAAARRSPISVLSVNTTICRNIQIPCMRRRQSLELSNTARRRRIGGRNVSRAPKHDRRTGGVHLGCCDRSAKTGAAIARGRSAWDRVESAGQAVEKGTALRLCCRRPGSGTAPPERNESGPGDSDLIAGAPLRCLALRRRGDTACVIGACHRYSDHEHASHSTNPVGGVQAKQRYPSPPAGELRGPARVRAPPPDRASPARRPCAASS